MFIVNLPNPVFVYTHNRYFAKFYVTLHEDFLNGRWMGVYPVLNYLLFVLTKPLKHQVLIVY